jgi:hypothetical protein
MSSVALWITQPPFQWVPWTLSPWMAWLGHDAELTPTSTAQVISAATPLLSPHGAHRGKFTIHSSPATCKVAGEE